MYTHTQQQFASPVSKQQEAEEEGDKEKKKKKNYNQIE